MRVEFRFRASRRNFVCKRMWAKRCLTGARIRATYSTLNKGQRGAMSRSLSDRWISTPLISLAFFARGCALR